METTYAIKRAGTISRVFSKLKAFFAGIIEAIWGLFHRYFIIALIIGVVLIGGFYLLRISNYQSSTSATSLINPAPTTNKVAIKPPNFSQTLNKEYTFAIKNDKNVEVAKLNAYERLKIRVIKKRLAA